MGSVWRASAYTMYESVRVVFIRGMQKKNQAVLIFATKLLFTERTT